MTRSFGRAEAVIILSPDHEVRPNIIDVIKNLD